MQCRLIQSLRDLINDPDFVARHRRSKTDFTRHRTLSFPIVFLLNLIKGALQRELDQFFQVLSPGDVAERVVTKSAFCAARQKLNPTAFIELNRHLVQRWYHDAPVQRWRGFDLRAIDGSTVRLPDTPEAIAQFGQMFPVIPPLWRGSRRTRSTASSSMPSSLPTSRTSASFWSSILQPSRQPATARLRLSGVLGVFRPPEAQARLVCPRRARHLVGRP
jgi:hypothetical protein